MKTFELTIHAEDAIDLAILLHFFAERIDRLGEHALPGIGEERAIFEGTEIVGEIIQKEVE